MSLGRKEIHLPHNQTSGRGPGRQAPMWTDSHDWHLPNSGALLSGSPDCGAPMLFHYQRSLASGAQQAMAIILRGALHSAERARMGEPS